MKNWNGSSDIFKRMRLAAAAVGLLIVLVGLLFPTIYWLAWVGFAVSTVAFAVDLILHVREEKDAAPRTLTNEQRMALLTRLSTITQAPISITYESTDEEAHLFARQLLQVFKDSGFDAKDGGWHIGGKPERGLNLVVCVPDRFLSIAQGIQQSL